MFMQQNGPTQSTKDMMMQRNQPNPFVVPDVAIGPLGTSASGSILNSRRRQRSKSGSQRRDSLAQKSSMSALIGDNLNDGNFRW